MAHSPSRVSHPSSNLPARISEKQRTGLIPARSLECVRNGHRPSGLYAGRQPGSFSTDFKRRLEAIVDDCERIGSLPILIIPPGNDASDPSQSYALPGTRLEARRALFERLTEIQAFEPHDAPRAIAAYREVLADQPTYAQTHHRLARLLESAGLFADANQPLRARPRS